MGCDLEVTKNLLSNGRKSGPGKGLPGVRPGAEGNNRPVGRPSAGVLEEDDGEAERRAIGPPAGSPRTPGGQPPHRLRLTPASTAGTAYISYENHLGRIFFYSFFIDWLSIPGLKGRHYMESRTNLKRKRVKEPSKSVVFLSLYHGHFLKLLVTTVLCL